MGYEAIQYIIPDYVTPEEYKTLLDKHGLKYLCVGAKFKAMSENPQAIQDAIKMCIRDRVYSMAFSLFSTSGMMNTFLQQLGILAKPVQFLQDNTHTWLSMWLWGQWKGLGWGAIMYLAAISGIDQELYEAARVDGAGRFRLIWHITCLLYTSRCV